MIFIQQPSRHSIFSSDNRTIWARNTNLSWKRVLFGPLSYKLLLLLGKILHSLLFYEQNRTIHAHGLAYRCLELSKIIFIGKKRVKLAGIAVTDLLQGTGESLARNQQRDLTSLGYIILSLTSNNLIKGHHEQIGTFDPSFYVFNFSRKTSRLCVKEILQGSSLSDLSTCT